MNIVQAVETVRQGAYDEMLKKLYPRFDSDPEKYKSRICALLNAYTEHFPEPDDSRRPPATSGRPGVRE